MIYLPTKTVTFYWLTTNLYVHKPKMGQSTSPQVSRSSVSQSAAPLLLNTVKENKNYYTACQFERAKRVRDMYHAIRTPSMSNFKTIIWMNVIKNNPEQYQTLPYSIIGCDFVGVHGAEAMSTHLGNPCTSWDCAEGRVSFRLIAVKYLALLAAGEVLNC